MTQMTIMAGPERRRRWSADERLRILAEAFGPGGSVAQVSRRYDVSRGLIYHWRQEARRLSSQGFVPAVMTEEVVVGSAAPEPDGLETAAIVVNLLDGRCVRISSTAPPALVTAVLKALR